MLLGPYHLQKSKDTAHRCNTGGFIIVDEMSPASIPKLQYLQRLFASQI